MADLESIQCCSRGCEAFQGKGKNVRRFWEYVGAAILIMLLLFFIGSCLGCEACFECAAICDDNCDCDLEYCGRECDDISDQLFQCDGINCGDKKHIFSCHGKWDCSTCGGFIEYTVTVKYNDTEGAVYVMDPLKVEEEPYLPVNYPSDKPSEYYTFKGYYTKKSGGTQYVSENGFFVKKITKSITLYAQYEEKNAGETYTLHFDACNYFANPNSIDVVVGEQVWGTPEAPQLDGVTFQGWYTLPNGEGTLVAAPGKNWTFHLVPFNHKPSDWPRAVMLYAHYAVDTFQVRFHYDDGSTSTETVEYGTSLDSVMAGKNRSDNNRLYYFGGWSLYSNPGLADAIESGISVMDNYDLYEIRRDWISITFDLGVERITIDRLREGDTYQISQLEVPGTAQTLMDYVSDPGCNPGYAFDSWRLGTASGTDMYDTLIVSNNMTRTVCVKWKSVQYQIEYFVNGDNYSVEASGSGGVTLYSYGARLTLWDFGRWASRDDFLGWYLEGDPDNVFTTLPSGIYGNLKLYAKFR